MNIGATYRMSQDPTFVDKLIFTDGFTFIKNILLYIRIPIEIDSCFTKV